MTHFDFTDVFPIEINEMIWDYLPTSDLLNATLTCKLWNELIGKSEIFKKRIVINVNNLDKEKQICKLSNSYRTYETLNIRRYELPTDLNSLGDREWKKVFINIAKIKSQSKFIDLVKRNFPFVKELKIMNISILKLSKNALLSLPNLETLVFSDISLDVFEIFIENHPNLKSLSMRFVYKDIAHKSTVGAQLEKFLQKNEQLKHLEIYEDVTNDLMTVDISQKLKLNLKSLAVGLSHTSDEVRDNLIKFLKSEGATLRDLRIMFHQRIERQDGHRWGYWERELEEANKSSDDLNILINAWNELNALEKLTLRFMKNSEAFEVDKNILKTLKPNSTIKEIHIKHINCNYPLDAMLNIIKYASNIQTVYISTLNLKILKFLVKNFILLRAIKYATDEGDCKKEYDDMIAANKCENKFIKLSQAFLG